ncbi:lysozyme [Paraburkholderia sp. GAS448]|uniref:lysozyme n=1 Tax=Paraburkholderia sp. GAS448 TaxID=3035136 RepID=UPI003D1A1DFF
MTDALHECMTNTDPNSNVNVSCDRHGKPWKLSREGYTFMAVLESGVVNGTYKGKPVVDGFIVKVYDDGYGIPTVGLGHKVLPQDNLKIGDVISVDRCRSFFEINLRPIEDAINRDVRLPLHQYEYDALVSVLYNTGPNHRKGDAWFPENRSTYLADFINKGEYYKIPEIIREFVAKRIPWRRPLEARLFEAGNYDARH